MELPDKIPFENINKKIKCKWGQNTLDMLFISAFVVGIISCGVSTSILDTSNAERLFSVLRYLIAFVAAVKIYFFSGYSIKELIAESVLLLVLGYSGQKGGDKTLLFSAMMIFAAKDVDMKKICRYAFFATAGVVVVLVSLAAFKIIPDSLQLRNDGLVRHSFGFAHPNALGLWVMMAVSEFYAAYNEKLNVACYAVTAVVALAVYKATNSRASFIVMLLLAALTPAVKYVCQKEKSLKAVKKLFVFAIASVGILSIVLMVIFNENNKVVDIISRAVSNRIYLGNIVYKEYGLSILGDGRLIGDAQMPVVDCVYMKISLTAGVLSLAALIYFQCRSAARSFDAKMAVLGLICLLWAAYGTMEVFTYDVFFNVSLLAAGAAMNSKRE